MLIIAEVLSVLLKNRKALKSQLAKFDAVQLEIESLDDTESTSNEKIHLKIGYLL